MTRVNALLRSSGGLNFDGPFPLGSDPSIREKLSREERLCDATLEPLQKIGVRHFCWLRPLESLGASIDSQHWPDGAFVYL